MTNAQKFRVIDGSYDERFDTLEEAIADAEKGLNDPNTSGFTFVQEFNEETLTSGKIVWDSEVGSR